MSPFHYLLTISYWRRPGEVVGGTCALTPAECPPDFAARICAELRILPNARLIVSRQPGVAPESGAETLHPARELVLDFRVLPSGGVLFTPGPAFPGSPFDHIGIFLYRLEPPAQVQTSALSPA